MTIPKIIHQIHLGGSAYTNNMKKWQASWKIKNPTFQYMLWTDHIIRKIPIKNRETLASCSNFSEKSDILRYEILYKYGGVYVDTDMECLREIDTFLKNENFIVCKQIPEEETGDKVCGAFLAAEKKHKLIGKLVEGIRNRNHTHGNESADKKFGPRYISDVIDKKYYKDSKYVYPFMWYDKYSYENNSKKYPEAYAVHYWNASWWDNKSDDDNY